MVTRIDDYMNKIQNEFPYLTIKEIKKILIRGFGLLVLSLLVKLGCSLQLTKHTEGKKRVFIKIGNIHLNNKQTPLQKHISKLMLLHSIRKDKWDGYYYIPLTRTQLLKFKEQGKINQKVYAYKFIDLCRAHTHNMSFIYKMKAKEGQTKQCVVLKNGIQDSNEITPAYGNID